MSGPGSKPTILVVEDDQRLANLIAKYLAANSLEVRVATRGDDIRERRD